MIRRASLVLLVCSTSSAAAQQLPPGSAIGSVSSITIESTRESKGSDDSSSSSFDRDTLIEHVVEQRQDGVVLDYALPSSATTDEREIEWQFPVRVLVRDDGSRLLLNRPDLEQRRDNWLKKAGLQRDACGSWYFTWNAFKVECDPDSALEIIKSFNLWLGPLDDGTLYRDPAAIKPAALTRKSSGSSGATYTAILVVDPDVIRHQQAEADVVIAQILKKPLTLNDALQAQAKQRISGAIEITLETDRDGVVLRRVRKMTIRSIGADDVTKDSTLIQITQRKAT